jgi:hypothetical protein
MLRLACSGDRSTGPEADRCRLPPSSKITYSSIILPRPRPDGATHRTVIMQNPQ